MLDTFFFFTPALYIIVNRPSPVCIGLSRTAECGRINIVHFRTPNFEKMAGLDNISGEEDVHLTYEDQQKINQFARCNTRLEEVKEELKTKETDLHNLGDAEDEMMIALDADEKVPYLLGEVFLLKTQESAAESIGKEKESINEEIAQLKSKATDLEASMSQLKADLYAKFGNNINLEADDD